MPIKRGGNTQAIKDVSKILAVVSQQPKNKGSSSGKGGKKG